MKFEWDPQKAQSNQVKHGVRFEEAISAFDDPRALIATDSKHSTEDEKREWIIGETDSKSIVVIIYTDRGIRRRLISARPASRKERKMYETLKTVPF